MPAQILPILLFTLAALTSSLSAQSTLPDTSATLDLAKPGHVPSVSDIYIMLGIHPEANDIAPTLKATFAGLKKKPADTTEILDPLVDLLLRGIADDSLINALVAETTVADDAKIENAYGDGVFGRFELARLLWQKAKTDHSQRYAYAALLLPFAEGFRTRPGYLADRFVDDIQFHELTHLSDDQAKAIKDLVAQSGSLEAVSLASAKPSLLAVDKLMINGYSVAQVPIALATLDNWWNNSGPLLSERWLAAHTLWTLLAHARMAEDAVAIQEIKDQISRWQTQSTDPRVMRWLKEALTHEGKPGRLHVTFTIDRDGTTRVIEGP